jgi:hypothetical protein
VYTSAWHCSLWQSVSDLYDFRAYMERRPGGSYPEKFEKTLADFCRSKGIACPGYVQHTGGDDEFLDLAMKTGRMIGVTYCGVDGQGRYGNSVVGHMVNLVYLDRSLAAVLDNNYPGTWLWMSRTDFLCRWRGIQSGGKPFLARDQFGRAVPIGGGWAIVLLGPPPAPYPAVPSATRFDAIPDHTEPVQYRYPQPGCPNGKCPLQQPPANPFQVPPGFPNPIPGPAPVVPDQMPAAKVAPIGNPPGPDFEWGYLPRIGWGWVQKGILPQPAPVEKAPPQPRPEQKAETPKAPEEQPEFIGQGHPQGGVDFQKLTTEKRWSLNGERVTKEEAHAALSLTDDSYRWNLSVVGEPGFLRKLRDDVAALPADTRAKLHLQTYSPTDWQVTQFRLGQGVTLRRPALNRVGHDVGTVPVADYAPGKLAELLTAPDGPTPAPVPAPSPRPKEPTPAPAPKVDPAPAPDVKPVPKVDPAPANPEPQPAPLPAPKNDPTGIVAVLLALVAGAWYLIRR